jgi:hypothetical protein
VNRSMGENGRTHLSYLDAELREFAVHARRSSERIRCGRLAGVRPGDLILANECVQLRLECSVGVSPSGGKVRNLRSLGRIRGGNEWMTPAMEAGIADHVWNIDEIVGLLG